MPRVKWHIIILALILSQIFSLKSKEKTSKELVDLLKIYHLALDNDMNLAMAKATYNANLENYNIARAKLFPQLSMTGNVANNRQVNCISAKENLDKNNGLPRSFSWNEHVWNASLSQSIFNPVDWFTFKVAKSQNITDLAIFGIAQQDLIMRVAEGYFHVLRLEDIVATKLAEKRSVKRQMIQAQERFKVGLLPRVDVEEVRASFDAVIVKVIEAKNNLNIAYKQLATITGKPMKSLANLAIDIPLYKPDPAKPSAWVKSAVEKNLNMKVAKNSVNTSRLQLRSAKSGNWPEVAVVGTYQKDRINSGRNRNRANTMVYSLNVTMPIFSGGQQFALINQNMHNLSFAQYQVELEERKIKQDTLGFYDTVNADIARIKAACQGVISAGIAMNVTESGYKAGIRTIMDVLQSQQNLYSAQQLYLDSRYNYIIDTLKLKQTAGMLNPSDIVQLNNMLIHSKTEIDVNSLLPICNKLLKEK